MSLGGNKPKEAGDTPFQEKTPKRTVTWGGFWDAAFCIRNKAWLNAGTRVVFSDTVT